MTSALRNLYTSNSFSSVQCGFLRARAKFATACGGGDVARCEVALEHQGGAVS